MAALHPTNLQEADVRIDNNNFLIGRAKNASYDIKDLSVSRTQCIIQFQSSWTLCDKSNAGTWLNGKRLEQNKVTELSDGDHIKLGDSNKYNYVFCTNGQNCLNSCKNRSKTSKLDAELAQRRRVFEFNASRQKEDLENSILQNQQGRHELELQQRILHEKFNKQLQKLMERNGQLMNELAKKGGSSERSLEKEKEQLEVQLRQEKQKLEENHLKETSELASKIESHQKVEEELKSQNKALMLRLEHEKQQFEIRLEEEKKLLEVKFAEQLAEQLKLAKEKSEVEEALRRRIRDLEEIAHQEEEQQQQRKAEQKEDEARLSKEKIEYEERLRDLQNTLQEKEKQEKEKELAFLERERELKAQEELIERERQERAEKLEAEFLAKRKELEQLESEKRKELDRHREEVTKDLQDREAELKRKAEEHQKELEAQKAREEGVRTQLEWEILKLQEEKVAIEMNIRGEQSKKEGENAKTLEKLQAELEVVKFDLDKTSTKRKLLEKELEEASRAKEAASKSELEARKTVVENFGELMESELQCSICNELFVVATTLNCNHTFCQLCISNWLEKKKDCPICRTPTVSNSRSIVLDNFIDKMVENLTEDLKRRRKEIVEERRAHIATIEDNPSKKRKTAPRQIAVTLPLQIVNHNVGPILHNGRVLMPVPTIPAGATVYRPAPAPNTNSVPPLLAGGPSTSHVTRHQHQVFQQHRQQPSQQQHAPSARPSSSAPNRMTIQTQPHHGVAHPGIRTRGGGIVIRQPHGMPVTGPPPRVVQVATRPSHALGAPRGVQTTAAPRTVPPLVLRGAPGLGYTIAPSTPINRPTHPHQ